MTVSYTHACPWCAEYAGNHRAQTEKFRISYKKRQSNNHHREFVLKFVEASFFKINVITFRDTKVYICVLRRPISVRHEFAVVAQGCWKNLAQRNVKQTRENAKLISVFWLIFSQQEVVCDAFRKIHKSCFVL